MRCITLLTLSLIVASEGSDAPAKALAALLSASPGAGFQAVAPQGQHRIGAKKTLAQARDGQVVMNGKPAPWNLEWRNVPMNEDMWYGTGITGGQGQIVSLGAALLTWAWIAMALFGKSLPAGAAEIQGNVADLVTFLAAGANVANVSGSNRDLRGVSPFLAGIGAVLIPAIFLITLQIQSNSAGNGSTFRQTAPTGGDSFAGGGKPASMLDRNGDQTNY